jgi:hypothetical protein
MRNDNNVCRRGRFSLLLLHPLRLLLAEMCRGRAKGQAGRGERRWQRKKKKGLRRSEPTFLTPFIISSPHLFRFVSRRRDVVFSVHALISLRGLNPRALMKRLHSEIPLNIEMSSSLEHKSIGKDGGPLCLHNTHKNFLPIPPPPY